MRKEYNSHAWPVQFYFPATIVLLHQYLAAALLFLRSHPIVVQLLFFPCGKVHVHQVIVRGRIGRNPS